MKTLLLSMLLAALAAVPAAASWQTPAPQPGAQEEFVPVTSVPQAEQLPAAPLLVAAYAFVWAALLVYVWLLWRRMSALERELEALERRLPKA